MMIEGLNRRQRSMSSSGSSCDPISTITPFFSSAYWRQCAEISTPMILAWVKNRRQVRRDAPFATPISMTSIAAVRNGSNRRS